MEWTIDGALWRVATAAEIAALREEAGAPHVHFACEGCGKAYWHAKNIALGPSGRYNGARNLFYEGDYGTECQCPAAQLVCVVPS